MKAGLCDAAPSGAPALIGTLPRRPGASDRGVDHPARVAAIGSAITGFAFLDADTVGLLIAVLAAWLSALNVSAVVAVVLTFINGACCRSVERQWDAWIAGNSKRMETTLAKRRTGRLMRHPVAWIRAYASITVGAGMRKVPASRRPGDAELPELLISEPLLAARMCGTRLPRS